MPMPNVSPSGVTAMETIVGAVTFRLVDGVKPPNDAEMVVVPAATELTMPAALIFAVAVEDELQDTNLVRSELLPSVYLPVAVNCSLVLTGMEKATGDIVIDCKLAAAPAPVTFKVAVACTFPVCAVIVTDPDVEPAASPELLIEATLESAELHCTLFVMSFAVPSESWAVAENCCTPPVATDADPGAICNAEIDGNCDCVCDPEPPPQLLIMLAKIISPTQKAAFIMSPIFASKTLPSDDDSCSLAVNFWAYSCSPMAISHLALSCCSGTKVEHVGVD
jgi:hypothetical protein